VGATDLNGTTNEDRTNYFETVPVSSLDLVLWLESDRMGFLKGAINQAKLDEQRGVVQNELRQYANEPYAVTEELIARALSGRTSLFLDRRGLHRGPQPGFHRRCPQLVLDLLWSKQCSDCHFRRHKASRGSGQSKKYFGSIPPSPPIARQAAWIAKRSGVHRQQVQDRVPQARLIKSGISLSGEPPRPTTLTWPAASWGTARLPDCINGWSMMTSWLIQSRPSLI